MRDAASSPVDAFLPYMADVSRCERSLRELDLSWRSIEWSAKLNCPAEARAILPTMAATRVGFERLERDLVDSLVREKVGTLLAGLATQAQYAIDLVVRNLYERTADIGFLATDRELCAFAAGMNGDTEAIRRRLRAYRSKYTVYDDIVVLDTQGRVLARIDGAGAPAASTDLLVGQTLNATTGQSYIETFRACDLQPQKRQALVYSRRMLHPDSGVPVGVLCLCFGFDDEMAGIFNALGNDGGRTLLLLLDADGRVIASGDPAWVPPGAQVPVNHEGDGRLLLYGGREYLVRTRPATGYQGYMGPPGWQAQVMTPVDVAFRKNARRVLEDVPAALARGLLTHARSFCAPLHEIVTAAGTIQRVVWNGQVVTAGFTDDAGRLEAVLDQISVAGERSNALFGQSIGELYETVLASYLRDAESIARLLVDLLDRNLYERANDCRWWSLTPELRHALAQPEQDFETRESLGAILQYINGLYTVYTRLVVYDRNGCIVASSSRDTDAGVTGRQIAADTLTAVLALRDEQQYHVTPFQPEALYDGRKTYVYHAAIRPGNEMEASEAVGGIGIVFDAYAEFHAMLQGALGDKNGMSALFVDRSGNVIASTDTLHPIGTRLELDPALLRLENGSRASHVFVHDNQYAVMACCASSGYREFKVADSYRDDVLAIVFHPLGAVRPHTASRIDIGPAPAQSGDGTRGPGTEFATFLVDDMMFAVPAATVVEACDASGLTATTMGAAPECVGMIACNRDGAEERYVWVLDLGLLVRGSRSTAGPDSQVIVLRHAGMSIGILVDELHAVPKFDDAHISPVPFSSAQDDRLVKNVIATGAGLLIQVLDVAQLFARIHERS
jgi:chemotaxis signal transduction protein